MEGEAHLVRSVGRAIGALRVVAAAGSGGIRLSEVAQQLALHKASAARILNTLVAERALDRGGDRRYRVGRELEVLLGLPPSLTRVRNAARAAISHVVDVLDDATLLSVRSGFDALCVERQIGSYPFQALVMEVGARRPLGIDSGGMALLAWLPEAEREALIDREEPRLRRYPKATAERLRQLAGETRELGYALMPGFLVDGMTGIAVPLRDPSGLVVAALSVGALTDRLSGGRLLLAAQALWDAQALAESRLADPRFLGQDWGPGQEPPGEKTIRGKTG